MVLSLHEKFEIMVIMEAPTVLSTWATWAHVHIYICIYIYICTRVSLCACVSITSPARSLGSLSSLPTWSPTAPRQAGRECRKPCPCSSVLSRDGVEAEAQGCPGTQE